MVNEAKDLDFLINVEVFFYWLHLIYKFIILGQYVESGGVLI